MVSLSSVRGGGQAGRGRRVNDGGRGHITPRSALSLSSLAFSLLSLLKVHNQCSGLGRRPVCWWKRCGESARSSSSGPGDKSGLVSFPPPSLFPLPPPSTLSQVTLCFTGYRAAALAGEGRVQLGKKEKWALMMLQLINECPRQR